MRSGSTSFRRARPFMLPPTTTVNRPGCPGDVSGSAKAILMVRLLSCLMGTVVVWLATDRVARELTSPSTATLAAACTAGVPMFVSLSGGVTNENLSALCAAASLYVIVLGIKLGLRLAQTQGPESLDGDRHRHQTDLHGTAAGGLARPLVGGPRAETAGGLLQPGEVFASVAARDGGEPCAGRRVVRTQHSALPHSHQALHQPKTVVRFFSRALPAHTGVPTSGPSATCLRWRSLGGSPSGANFPAWYYRLLPKKAYVLLLTLQIVAGLGLWRAWREGGFSNGRAAAAGAMVLCATVITAIFFQLNWQHATPQGRYFFPLLLPFGLATASGWRAAFPPRIRQSASYVLDGVLLFVERLHPERHVPSVSIVRCLRGVR